MKNIGPTCIRMVIATVVLNINPVFATDMSSASYGVKWDVTDGGGGRAVSANYIAETSAGQATAIGQSNSANYILVAGFKSIPDSDADTILDSMDNCTKVKNINQRDTNGDGFGNICDPDFDNNGFINIVDLGYMKSHFFTDDADADLDGNGFVNIVDLGIVKNMFFQAPGPSGLVP